MSVLGLVLLQLVGSALAALALKRPWRQTLQAPSSAWWALALLYAVALGPAGAVVVAFVVLACFGSARLSDAPPPGAPWPRAAWVALAVVLVALVARPWVPTQWDEFVWLAKARLESNGFGAGVRAALDPSANLIPAGYPPLWPAAVGWVSLGRDALGEQTLAASLLLWWALATAVHAWWPRLRRASGWAVVCGVAAPLVWVHARSTYVDLPLGLWSVALVGLLVHREWASSVVVAVVLAAVKDEGTAHVVAAAVAAAVTTRSWRCSWAAVAALATTGAWRLLASAHGISGTDHALSQPVFAFVPTLLRLLVVHASDGWSWGVLWPLVAATFVPVTRRLAPVPTDSGAVTLQLALVANAVISSAALLAGSERVRAFAEGGTLINRLLIQWWPLAAVLVVLHWSAAFARPRVS